jgi:hypothetical protein
MIIEREVTQMSVLTLDIDGKTYEFENRFASNRNGFSHHTTLTVGHSQTYEATCHYINRTWEKYTYQSSMMSAVAQLQTALVDRAIRNWKVDHNWARFGKNQKQALVEEVSTTPAYKEAEKVMEALRQR